MPMIPLSPFAIAATLLGLLAVGIILSVIFAHFTTRKQSDNGLRLEGTYKRRLY
jgi:hypothetical protein